MEEIQTDDAPASIGPHSQGVVDGDRVFVSGQGPVDPDSDEVVDGTVPEQTAGTLENVATVLEAGGSSLDEVVMSTVFVTDMEDYETVNEVYGDYMSAPTRIGVR